MNTFWFQTGLTMRARKAMLKLGFECAEDLKVLNVPQLERIKGIGDTTINEIREYCKVKGIKIEERKTKAKFMLVALFGIEWKIIDFPETEEMGKLQRDNSAKQYQDIKLVKVVEIL